MNPYAKRNEWAVFDNGRHEPLNHLLQDKKYDPKKQGDYFVVEKDDDWSPPRDQPDRPVGVTRYTNLAASTPLLSGSSYWKSNSAKKHTNTQTEETAHPANSTNSTSAFSRRTPGNQIPRSVARYNNTDPWIIRMLRDLSEWIRDIGDWPAPPPPQGGGIRG